MNNFDQKNINIQKLKILKEAALKDGKDQLTKVYTQKNLCGTNVKYAKC